MLVLLTAFSGTAYAQFRSEAFTQSYNDHKRDSLKTQNDSTDKVINFKEIFGGLAHKREMRIGSMFGTSVILPGAAQIYNREYWKLPIYWGGLVACAYFFDLNKTNYERFRRIYREATDPEVQYTGPINADTALYYRDTYRRYRDYSVLAFAVVYLLQVIDANVFSYMHDFSVEDDLTLNIEPAVISPDAQFASCNGVPSGVGLKLGLKF